MVPREEALMRGTVVSGISVLASTILALILGKRFLVHARRHALLDHPNDRSSHTVATPRGGGTIIVIPVIIAILITMCRVRGVVPWLVAVVGGGLAVAAVGWIDDRRGVSARGRLLVQLCAAVATVALLPADWMTALLPLPIWMLRVGFIVTLVWITNLYNFMDGIDGLAGSEAVTYGVVATGLCLTVGHAESWAIVPAALAGAGLGFLRWNWPRASMFMGDVGSGFVGFIVGAWSLGIVANTKISFVALMLPLGVFVVDATLTLVRRLLQGISPTTAHRSHAYQRLAQSGWSHRRVTVAVLGVNIGLGVLAFMTQWGYFAPVLSLVLAASMLTALYTWVERVQPL